MEQTFFDLQQALNGELKTDSLHTLMYATDASAYREEPLAVAFPVDNRDIHTIIGFCSSENIPLIPRTAGTSLAGQVVGKGLIVDVSKYLTQIIEINPEERYAIVQPGVIRDELNRVVAKHELFFAPETSHLQPLHDRPAWWATTPVAPTRWFTAAPATISSPSKRFCTTTAKWNLAHSPKRSFEQKLSLQNSEGELYRQIAEMLGNEKLQQEIHTQYPDPSLRRRNTGYALDMLLRSEVFGDLSRKFNFCDLIAGSEGTLCFITEIKVNLSPFPPKHKGFALHSHEYRDGRTQREPDCAEICPTGC